MKTKHLILENISDEYTHNWFHLLPLISIQHKFWYLWNINIGWLCFEWMLQITRRDWQHKGNFNDEE